MVGSVTLGKRLDDAGGVTSGFDYLRIGLAVFVLAWHSIWHSTGSEKIDHALWSGYFRFIPAAVLPMFFALSGFLVSGSLERTKLYQFITLRLLRLMPALMVEIALCACILGLIFTDLPKLEYLKNEKFYAYFLNIIGLIHYELPGVFKNNIGSGTINGQLWTIPFEFECYVSLVVLSISTLIKRRRFCVLVVIGLSIVYMIMAFTNEPVNPNEHVPGRMLVLTFLAAVSIFLYRDVIPCTRFLGILSAIATAIFLEIPTTCYLAAFPIAYLTVWLGLMRPPKILFGDLSYGVFLFHCPIEQTIMHVAPWIKHWWMLTLFALPISLAFAWLSWNLIERPILSQKKHILAKIDKIWIFSVDKIWVSAGQFLSR